MDKNFDRRVQMQLSGVEAFVRFGGAVREKGGLVMSSRRADMTRTGLPMRTRENVFAFASLNGETF